MPNTTQLENNELYAAIMKRRSVRRFDKRPLPESTLERVRAFGAEARPLVEQNRFTLLVRDIAPGEDLVKALQAYGRILNPPHFAVPYIVGKVRPLVDLGYRTQQIVVQMAQLNIGCCYIGALEQETTLRVRFVLRRSARMGAVLLFGRPASAIGGRTINAVMRTAFGSTRRLPVDEIFFRDSFDGSRAPSDEVAPLIEAARQAPSALNVQPWRFLEHEGRLYLFARPENPRYGAGPNQEYCYFDAGAAMANVTLALRAQDQERTWELLSGAEGDLPDHPADLEPIARLRL